MINLNPMGTSQLAWAYAAAKPAPPSSSASTFTVHDVMSYWINDFSMGENANFSALVAMDM